MKSRIMALAIVLMLLLGALFTVVPMTRVSANPSNSYTSADYINAIKKATDRLVALQDVAIPDYGWDWDVTGLSSHTGNPSATNIYGAVALGLIDAYGRTGTVQYASAAKNVADFMKYGDPSNGDFYNGHDSYYWGFSFDYRFLVGFSSMSGDAGYENYALAAWTWQKADRSDYYGDGNQTALYDWYVGQVNHGYAGWSASDWGLAAFEMGDTVWAQHMASVVSSNLADIINGTTPGGPSQYKDLGMAWALKLFVTVDPATYSSDIATLKSHLEVDQNALGYWSDGNPDGDAQTTAYAVIGLWAAGEYSSAGKGAEWLLANQMTDGGWTASPTEYSETDSEAMQALTEVFLPLTVVSAYDSPSPSSGLIPVGTSVTASVTSPVAGTVGTQYVCTSWTGTGSVSSGSGNTVTFTMTQPSTISWNWKTQYYLTVTSSFGAPTGQGWYDAGSTASASVTQPTTTPGVRILNLGYVGTGSAPTGSGTSVSFIITSPSSITWNWGAQYYLTVNNGGYGQTSGEGWYDEANEATFSISPTVLGGGNGVQYVFTGWSSLDVRGYTGPSPSHSVFMFNPVTETANWKAQCYLTVVSPYGVTSGAAWYDNGTAAYATLANGTVDIVPGSVRAVFTGWGGNASGTGLTSNPIRMDGPKTAVATWKIQYYLTVATDPSKLVAVPGEDWEDNGTQISLTAPQYVPNATGSAGVRYRFGYWDIDGTSQGAGANFINVQMNASHTATAHYVLQYLVTFNQSGVESDFSGTVVTVDNSTYGASTLPSSFWYDNGSTHTFAFQSPLPIAPGAQYNWTSTTGMSTSQSGSLIITGPGTVTGNYGARVAFTVTNVVDNCTWVYQGRAVTVNVTVKNNGNVPETVQVILYYNATDGNGTVNGIVGTQNVSIPIQESGSITFVWNTTSVPYCRNYTFTEFSSIPAGSSLTGNTLAGGNVRVRIMGDINNDDKVDMKDIGIAAHAFGSNSANPRWNADADINGDGKVDMRDVAVAARNFGQHG